MSSLMAWCRWLIPMLILAAGFSGALLGALGDWHRYFDIFAHFRVQFLIVGVSGLAAFALRRRAVVVLLLTLPLTVLVSPAIAWWSMATTGPEQAIAEPAPQTRPRSLKVISANILFSARNAAPLGTFIVREKPDILLLQEVSRPKYFRLKPYLALAGLRGLHCNRGPCSTLAYVKGRVIRASPIPRGRGEGPPRIEMVALLPGVPPLSLITAHVMRPIDSAYGHSWELARLANRVARLKQTGRPLIIGGDFNASYFSADLQRFARTGGVAHMGAYLPSWPVKTRRARRWVVPQIAIDHLFAAGATITDVRLGPDIGSDHLPVIARMRIE